MKRIKILIIEDEPTIVDLLRLYLEKEGFTIFSALNASKGLEVMEKILPEILLLDIHLPDENGFSLARRYRDLSEDGILIFISGERTQDIIMEGFNIGCDDYITKPFVPPEVIARIKANLRRSKLLKSQILQIGNLSLNFSEKAVYKNGQKLDLFTKEKMLLFYLAQHKDQVVSAEQLFESVWGLDSHADLKTVLVHLSTLRKKIEENPKKPQYIQTIRGFGYKFSAPPSKNSFPLNE